MKLPLDAHRDHVLVGQEDQFGSPCPDINSKLYLMLLLCLSEPEPGVAGWNHIKKKKKKNLEFSAWMEI